MKVPIALRIFLIGTVVLLVTAVPILFSKTFTSSFYKATTIYAQTTNCSINIYPQPTNGTGNYTVTFTDNTSTPFVQFTNNWWGGNDTIGNGGTGTINLRIYPTGWTRLDRQPYEIKASSATSIQQVTYGINLTLNNGFGGIDIGASSDNNFSSDLCTGHYSPSNITYNSPASTPTPSPTETPIPTPSPTPTPTPTPIPTTTPTPIPSTNLNVPILRQTDKPWGSQVYDGANYWSPMAKTIKSWGCALTSYVMVLKYFGINKLPNGINLDPETLNTWLKNNSGYIDGKRSGYLNPLTISSLSHQAIKINKITAFDGLEYSRVANSNNLLLINALNDNRPVVLEETGHYVVATGITSNSFSIIDPYFTNKTDLTSYGNTYASLNELKPTNTDLSYILVTADKDVNIQINDSNGNILGQEFLQQPLVNVDNNQPAGEPIKMALLAKPTFNNYTINLNSQHAGNYNSSIYLYDKNGEINTESFMVLLDSNKSVNINLNFNKQNVYKSSVSKTVTFDSLILDIKELKSLHLINSKVADRLIDSLKQIQKNYNKKFKIFTQFQLKFMNETLRFYDKKLISQETYQVIATDIKDLIKSL